MTENKEQERFAFEALLEETERDCLRSAADYEALPRTTGRTIAEIEIDTTEPDQDIQAWTDGLMCAEHEGEAMTWQLDESGGNFWMIRTETGELVATICHCDPATARLLCAAQEMREALVVLAGAVTDFHLTGPDDRSVKEWEASGARMLAACQRALRLAAGTGDEGQ